MLEPIDFGGIYIQQRAMNESGLTGEVAGEA